MAIPRSALIILGALHAFPGIGQADKFSCDVTIKKAEARCHPPNYQPFTLEKGEFHTIIDDPGGCTDSLKQNDLGRCIFLKGDMLSHELGGSFANHLVTLYQDSCTRQGISYSLPIRDGCTTASWTRYDGVPRHHVTCCWGEAVFLPYHYRIEIEIDSKQYAYTTVNILKDGEFTVNTRYSNAKPFDGDHFTTAVQILSRDGKPIATIATTTGVNASFFDSAVEHNAEQFVGKIANDKLNNVGSILISSGVEDRVDDKGFWKDVLKRVLAELSDDEDDQASEAE